MTEQTPHSTSPQTNPATISIPKLRAALNGQVITPEDAAYDEARTVFYGGFDRHPALIVRVADVTDVSHVIEFARESGLELAVKSGGHSVAGHSTTDGGIVLDLSEMKNLEIDVEGRTAWAESGLTAGEYTTAAGAHGLATGFGDTGSVGIGGITLGGGIGYLVRKHGLTIDNVLGDAYPASTWDRLAAIKGRYDPTNLFRRNQNIPPATEVQTTEQKKTSDGL
jgi:FAD/FMN-containing dehydrogenase